MKKIKWNRVLAVLLAKETAVSLLSACGSKSAEKEDADTITVYLWSTSLYEKYAPYISYAFCSFDGDDEAAKEHLKFIHSLGPELVSLTRGSKGCIMYDGEQFYTQPATLIDNVVDTMGAGDSFLTSFMDCYIDQLKRGTDRQEAIRTSLKEASKFAAHVCTLNGAFGYGKPYED